MTERQVEPDQAERGARARADLITALVLVAIGLGVTYLSWTMPRLEVRRIHPSTIPGLVPLFLGLALVGCSLLLAVRSMRIVVPGSWRGLLRGLAGGEARRALAALALVLIYALVLVGRLPFAVASGLFIFAFIVLFEIVLSRRENVLGSLLWAGGIATVAGGGIAYVFQYIFLVRLP